MRHPGRRSLIEEGSPALDPYEPFLAARANDDPPSTCEATRDAELGELRREILRLAGPILLGAGIVSGQTVCHIEPEAARLQVTFDLPVAVTPAVRQALAVRVLDAVRGAGRTYGAVEVSVHDRRDAV